MEFQVRYLVLFLLFSVIDGFSWFWMGSFHRSWSLVGVSQGSIPDRTLYLLCINDLPAGICNIAIYADNTTLHS